MSDVPPYDSQGNPQQHPQSPHGQPPQAYSDPHGMQSAPAPAHGGHQPANRYKQDSIFSALGDTKFTKFATNRILTIIYIVSLVMIGLFALGLIVSARTSGAAGLLVALIIVPIIAFSYVLYTRLVLEFFAIQFRQRELLEEISRKLDR